MRTDFILSAEIIVIALGTVAGAPFMQQLAVLAGIALVMTVGVYGIVAGIVKMDDAGLYLSQRAGGLGRAVGRLLLAAAPQLMKLLSVAGTVAMFMVGGAILMHGRPGAHALVHHAAQAVATVPAVGPLLAATVPSLIDAGAGTIWKRLKQSAQCCFGALGFFGAGSGSSAAVMPASWLSQLRSSQRSPSIKNQLLAPG